MENKEARQSHLNEMINLWTLDNKIKWAEKKIEEFLTWVDGEGYPETVIGYSGGKDSTAMLDLVVKVHKRIKSKTKLIMGYATEITFPDTMKYIKEVSEFYGIKLEVFPPKMGWNKILHEKGFPVKGKRFSVMVNRLINSKSRNYLTYDAFGLFNTKKYPDWKPGDIKQMSVYYVIRKNDLFYLDPEMCPYIISEKCCDYVKGGIKHDKRPAFVGTQADESYLRKTKWIQNGCNVFGGEKPMSKPISIWTADDVWAYKDMTKIKRYNPMYKYFDRLGCVSCTFGSHLEQKKKLSKNNPITENRFDILYRANPAMYKSQVWGTDIYKIIADMGVTVEADKEYMEYFNKRRAQIDAWNDDLQNNLIKVMHRITIGKEWTYSFDDICEAYAHFKLKRPTKKLFDSYFKK